VTFRLAKKASNNFKVAKDAVTSTGLKFSVTGHGVGGAVAALAALEMGAVANEPKVYAYLSTVSSSVSVEHR
jgi:alpha-beta hydrolase superfamily lysophospholipase